MILFVCVCYRVYFKLKKRKSCNTHELIMLKSIRCTSDVFAWVEIWKTKHELCLQPVAPHHNTFRFHNSACLFIYVCSLFGYPTDVECTNIALLNNEFKAPLCVFMESPVPTEIFFRSDSTQVLFQFSCFISSYSDLDINAISSNFWNIILMRDALRSFIR